MIWNLKRISAEVCHQLLKTQDHRTLLMAGRTIKATTLDDRMMRSKIQLSTRACKDEHSEYHSDSNTYCEQTRGSPPSMPSSPLIVYLEVPKSTSASPPVADSPVGTRSYLDLIILKCRLENAVLCNQSMHQECTEPNWPAHKHHCKRPL